MSQARPERADAVRNRRAILAATEELLATHRPQDISIEQVAVAAGVGKGTVFHRFGSRMGLMTALMVERAQALTEAVTSGPPPLGPGAPDRERLLAFLDAVIEVVGRNKSLLAELAFSGAAEPAAAGKGGHQRRPSGLPLLARPHQRAHRGPAARRRRGDDRARPARRPAQRADPGLPRRRWPSPARRGGPGTGLRRP